MNSCGGLHEWDVGSEADVTSLVKLGERGNGDLAARPLR
jgi:hypothetical protein